MVRGRERSVRQQRDAPVGGNREKARVHRQRRHIRIRLAKEIGAQWVDAKAHQPIIAAVDHLVVGVHFRRKHPFGIFNVRNVERTNAGEDFPQHGVDVEAIGQQPLALGRRPLSIVVVVPTVADVELFQPATLDVKIKMPDLDRPVEIRQRDPHPGGTPGKGLDDPLVAFCRRRQADAAGTQTANGRDPRHRVEVAIFAPVFAGVKQKGRVFGRQIARPQIRQRAAACEQTRLLGKNGEPKADD